MRTQRSNEFLAGWQHSYLGQPMPANAQHARRAWLAGMRAVRTQLLDFTLRRAPQHWTPLCLLPRLPARPVLRLPRPAAITVELPRPGPTLHPIRAQAP